MYTMDTSLNSFYALNGYPSVDDNAALSSEWEPSENDLLLFGGAAGETFGISTASLEAEATNDMLVRLQWPSDNNHTGKQPQESQHSRYAGYLEDDDHDMVDPQLEELFQNALYFGNHDDDVVESYQTIEDQMRDDFMDPLVTTDEQGHDHQSTSIEGLPLEERYKVSLEKLEAPMRRSQETRNCLTMKTSATESYERSGSVHEIMSSIATSSNKVRKLVATMKHRI